MSEYFPTETGTKVEIEKYWNINEHFLSVMGHSRLTRGNNGSEEINRRDDVVRDMIRIFSAISRNSLKSEDADANPEGNVALSNLLLLSLLDQ
jgi:hypothetical protein